MKLAKPYIDVGLYSNHLDAALAFWQQEVGLEYEELLKIGGGVHQHRLSLNGSVLKLNVSREPLAEAATGYKHLFIAADVTTPKKLNDPDGNQITLVPPGHLDITHIGIGITVSRLDNAQKFLGEVLDAKKVGENRYKLGTSIILLNEDPAQPTSAGMTGAGIRYLTVQVYKVDEEHRRLVAAGAVDAMPPKTLGETARISFISDLENNWIEISQRKSLTGDLST